MYYLWIVRFLLVPSQCVGYQRNAEERRCNVSQGPAGVLYLDLGTSVPFLVSCPGHVCTDSGTCMYSQLQEPGPGPPWATPLVRSSSSAKVQIRLDMTKL